MKQYMDLIVLKDFQNIGEKGMIKGHLVQMVIFQR
jgi:hypothetical protein